MRGFAKRSGRGLRWVDDAPHRIELRGQRRSDVVDRLLALLPDL